MGSGDHTYAKRYRQNVREVASSAEMIGLVTARPAGLTAMPVHIEHEGGQETVKIQ